MTSLAFCASLSVIETHPGSFIWLYQGLRFSFEQPVALTGIAFEVHVQNNAPSTRAWFLSGSKLLITGRPTVTGRGLLTPYIQGLFCKV